jgi:TetR/AcrR family transcriptional repressor of nem operon
MTVSTTRDLVLDETEKLIRTRGYAAFSYADLSERVGIQKASIHYHFPTKEVLGSALIDAYLVKFESDLQGVLDEVAPAGERLRRYAQFFVTSTSNGLLPFCGALAAEMSILPKSMQDRVRHFFALHLKWLNVVLSAGIAAKELRQDLDVETTARLILSTLEGGSLVAWATDDRDTVLDTFQHVFADIQVR